MNIKEHWRDDTDKAKLKYKKETCASVTLSTINSTWTALGLNLGLHGEKLVIYSLPYGMLEYNRCRLEEPTTNHNNCNFILYKLCQLYRKCFNYILILNF